MTEINDKGDNLNKRQIKSKGQSNIDNPEKLVTLEGAIKHGQSTETGYIGST